MRQKKGEIGQNWVRGLKNSLLPLLKSVNYPMWNYSLKKGSDQMRKNRMTQP